MTRQITKMICIGLDEFIEVILQESEHNRITFLIGAGVSMLPPSCLPSGPGLKDMAFASLAKLPVLMDYWKAVENSPKYRSILPEILFQRLWEYLGDEIVSFFSILRHAEPNLGHYVLTNLSLQFNLPVLTTNFDLLIEIASGNSLRVEHLHGSLDHPFELVTRLNQVGRASSRLDPGIMQHLQGRTLCVLGYSGYDTDIRNALDLSGVARILWLARDSSDAAWMNAGRLKKANLVTISNGDLIDFFATAARRYGIHLQTSHVSKRLEDRQQALKSWSESITTANRFLCVSRLLLEIDDFLHATAIAIEGKRHTRPKDTLSYRVSAANILRITAAFEEGMSMAREAVALASDTDPYMAAKAYNSLGLLLLEKEDMDPDSASSQFSRALEHLESLERATNDLPEAVLVLLSRVLNNLGLSVEEKEPGRAVPLYKRSLSVKRRTGDLLGIAQTAANLSIAYYKQAKWPSGYKWERKALKIMDLYELNFPKSYLLRRAGGVLCRLGRLKAGLARLRHALEIAERIEGAWFDVKLIREEIDFWTHPSTAKESPPKHFG